MLKTCLAILIVLLIDAVGLPADQSLQWPHFRGPNGSGVADDQQPPVEFGPDKNVKWKVPVPSGLSSPIVAGDKLVVTAFDAGKLYTIAYNRATGAEAWRAEARAKQIEPFHKKEGSPAASTAATDGEHVVSYFGSCGLTCYDRSGKELWRFELSPPALFGEFGSGVSPIIADGLVVLVRDQKTNSKIYAIDLATGSLKWEKDRKSPVSYCTPIVWETVGGKQVVSAGHARMIGYDLKTGTEKWSAGDLPSGCCSSPVAANDMLYFAGGSPGESEDTEPQLPSFDSMLQSLDKDKDGVLSREEGEKAFEGFFDNQDANKDGKLTRDEWDATSKLFSEGKNTAFALRAGGTGDVTASHVIWKQTKGLPYVPSAILYRGKYIMVKDGGIVTAYDAKSGEKIFQKRAAKSGTYYASPVAANGYIYLVSLDGAVTVLKADADEPTAVATAEFNERIAATPAIADNTLYIRTDKHLYAFGTK